MEDDELDRAKTLGIAEAAGGKRRVELDEFGKEKKRARTKKAGPKTAEEAPCIPPEEHERQKRLVAEINQMADELEAWRKENLERRRKCEKALRQAEKAGDKELAKALKLQLEDLESRQEPEKLTRSKLQQEFVEAEHAEEPEQLKKEALAGIDNRMKNAMSVVNKTGFKPGEQRLVMLEAFHAFLRRRQPKDGGHVKLGGLPPNPFARMLDGGAQEGPTEREQKILDASELLKLREGSPEEVAATAKSLAEEIDELEDLHEEAKRTELLAEFLREHYPNDGKGSWENRIKSYLSDAKKGEVSTKESTRLEALRKYRDFLRARPQKSKMVRLGSAFVPPNPFGYLFEPETPAEGKRKSGPARISSQVREWMRNAGEQALKEIKTPEVAAKKFAENIEEWEIGKGRTKLAKAFLEAKAKKAKQDLLHDPEPLPSAEAYVKELSELMAEAQNGKLKKWERLRKLKEYWEFAKATKEQPSGT